MTIHDYIGMYIALRVMTVSVFINIVNYLRSLINQYSVIIILKNTGIVGRLVH